VAGAQGSAVTTNGIASLPSKGSCTTASMLMSCSARACAIAARMPGRSLTMKRR
jgi:hypothetical protein